MVQSLVVLCVEYVGSNPELLLADKRVRQLPFLRLVLTQLAN